MPAKGEDLDGQMPDTEGSPEAGVSPPDDSEIKPEGGIKTNRRQSGR